MKSKPLLVLALLPAVLHAVNTLPESESEAIDVWGSVLYCQAIYDEPGVSDRIYEGDRNSCNEAHRSLGMHVLDTFPEEDAQTLFEHARHKASVIRYNTRSVQEAVAACRELCRSYND